MFRQIYQCHLRNDIGNGVGPIYQMILVKHLLFISDLCYQKFLREYN